ncbi:MAG: hypothetical protein IJI33_03810 [Solobacterium sp.]|nr:hypothetical protein [Solobacterium sp.]MBR0213433.1 hypothetical protein [Solobacterium sp.]MBR0397707.1 hypothetical protein [Eubacterium sp.]
MRHTGQIDSPFLKEQLSALAREKGGYDVARFSAKEIEELINRQPDPDVEQIIQCKDCVRRDSDNVCCWWNIHIRDIKNYCMYGKDHGDPNVK